MTKKNVYYLIDPAVSDNEEERFPEFNRSSLSSKLELEALPKNDTENPSCPEEK